MCPEVKSLSDRDVYVRVSSFVGFRTLRGAVGESSVRYLISYRSFRGQCGQLYFILLHFTLPLTRVSLVSLSFIITGFDGGVVRFLISFRSCN